LIPGFSGRSRYLVDYQDGPYHLLVAVRCVVGANPEPTYALLDTAAEWCVLPADLARTWVEDLTPDPLVSPLQTRFGLLYGRLERMSLSFLAEEGRDLDIDATFFLSQDWIGPVVIGWRGCLERMNLALITNEDAFYFAEPQ
jgi:hypothetical protein